MNTMAKFKKCTDKDISTLLETNSDSDVKEFDESYVPEEGINNSSDSSDSEKIFDHNRKLLLRSNALQKEQASLRLKLRRSTEQSMYKIDTDSEDERPKRITRSTKHCLRSSPNKNRVSPRKGARIIKLPKRYSDYECLPSTSQASILQRDKINYNEQELLLASLDIVTEREEESSKHAIKNDNSDDSDCICVNFTPKKSSMKSTTMSKSNKQSPDYSLENINDNVPNTPKRSRTAKNSRKNILIVSNQFEPTIREDECKNKVDEIEVIEKVGKNLSKNKQKEKDIKNTTESLVLHGLNTPKSNVSLRHSTLTPSMKKCNIDEVLSKTCKELMYSNPGEMQHVSLDSTPKKSRTNKNSRRSILTVSNQYEPIMNEDECESKVDEIEVIEKVDKNLSKSQRKKKDIKNTTESLVLNTPKSRVSLRHNTLTPSMKIRSEALVKPTTPLQKARNKLHVGVVPKSLPCREEQFNNIYTFLKNKLTDHKGGCFYINGIPGTGKTATVNEVVTCLKKFVDKGKLDYFDFVEINGMKVSEPRQVYVQILKQLSGKILTWGQAHNALEKRFKNSAKRPMTLLLVDELDLLCTKRQDIIYDLLDWSTKDSSQLIVVTISNTHDLPERVLMDKITSRLGSFTRETFEPYDHKQLQEIVLTRLKDINIFKSEAIELIARKISAASGDARRALDICRRAAEITETRDGTTVTIQDVNEALSMVMTNPKVQAIRYCSKLEQLFLQAVHAEVKRTGVQEVCFIKVYRRFESLCYIEGHETLNITQMLDVCMRLGEYKLLICDDSSSDIHQRIKLNVSPDDMHYALEKVDLD